MGSSFRNLVLCAWMGANCLAQTPLTARQLTALIQQHVGATLPADTVDTFKAGNPDEPVRGIAVTMMATYDVLERAAAAGDNLVITHEPTFYNHRDTLADLDVLKEKQAFIAAHHLVVWRFHDGWHLRKPDGILTGMTRQMEWPNQQVFVLPETSLNDLALTLKAKLGIKVMRVVGNPEMHATKIALLPGAAGSARQIQLLERPDVEVLVIGETPEWETVEYTADAVSEGKKKALIILGHIPSEQAGMQECAVWLRSFLPETKIDFVAAKEPFFSPLATR